MHDTATTPAPIFTVADVGTVFDGAHGWHNTYRLIDLAVGHGMTLDEDESTALELYRADGGAGASGTEYDYADTIIDQGGLHDRARDYLDALCAPGVLFDFDAGEVSITTLCRTEQYDPRMDECECGTCGLAY